MTELSTLTSGPKPQALALAGAEAAALSALAALQPCDECVGTGGWYRYEPALDPAPGMLYLSCVHCRGSGRMALARG
jgi:hypothetical protein